MLSKAWHRTHIVTRPPIDVDELHSCSYADTTHHGSPVSSSEYIAVCTYVIGRSTSAIAMIGWVLLCPTCVCILYTATCGSTCAASTCNPSRSSTPNHWMINSSTPAFA